MKHKHHESAAIDRTLLDVTRLARIGAPLRLAEIDAERASILRMFPGIEQPDAVIDLDQPITSAEPPTAKRTAHRTKAFRAATAKRVRAYWKSPAGQKELTRRRKLRTAAKKSASK